MWPKSAWRNMSENVGLCEYVLCVYDECELMRDWAHSRGGGGVQGEAGAQSLGTGNWGTHAGWLTSRSSSRGELLRKDQCESWEEGPEVERGPTALELVQNLWGAPRWPQRLPGHSSLSRPGSLVMGPSWCASSPPGPWCTQGYLFTAGMLLHTCTAFWTVLPRTSWMVTGSV